MYGILRNKIFKKTCFGSSISYWQTVKRVRQASKQAGRQASRRAGEQASRQAGKQASKQTGNEKKYDTKIYKATIYQNDIKTQ
jgi:hypothetical protein